MAERRLIVGLGNPGKKYEKTRHNVGFWVVDELAQRHGINLDRTERKSVTGDGLILGRRVQLAKPQTYMNASGESVRAMMDFYKIEPAHLIVITDDLDIPLGTLRLRKTGGSGGQKGLKNIMQHLGTQEIDRVRFGIGRPPGRMDPAAYVLQTFKGDDEITARLVVERAADAVETWLTDGMDTAMNRYNGQVVEDGSS
jgi:PTH1 family peptidyl-tRNA hydrolase